MNLFENLQLMKEANKNNILTVKIQSGVNKATDGQGYYNIFPERDKSNLTIDLWNKLKVSKLDVTHFPSYNEAEEYIQDFADENNIDLKIESIETLNELVSDSNFKNPLRITLKFDNVLSDNDMKKLTNISLNLDVLVDNSDGTYQICIPGKEDWITEIKRIFSNAVIEK